MEDHTQMSWKEDNVIARLHNSVDNATIAVGQALTNPTDQFIEQAQAMIERADRTVIDALESRGSLEPITALQQELEQKKAQLNRLH